MVLIRKPLGFMHAQSIIGKSLIFMEICVEVHCPSLTMTTSIQKERIDTTGIKYTLWESSKITLIINQTSKHITKQF